MNEQDLNECLIRMRMVKTQFQEIIAVMVRYGDAFKEAIAEIEGTMKSIDTVISSYESGINLRKQGL